MQRFSKLFGRKLVVGFLGLGLTVGAATSHAGEGTNESFSARNVATSEVTSKPSDGVGMLFSYKGKKVLVRLLNVKDKDWVGQCIDEDGVSITVQINNNVFTFFFQDIEYIESL